MAIVHNSSDHTLVYVPRTMQELDVKFTQMHVFYRTLVVTMQSVLIKAMAIINVIVYQDTRELTVSLVLIHAMLVLVKTKVSQRKSLLN